MLRSLRPAPRGTAEGWTDRQGLGTRSESSGRGCVVAWVTQASRKVSGSVQAPGSRAPKPGVFVVVVIAVVVVVVDKLP